MSISPSVPPVKALLETSARSLQELELASLNRSSNLEKGIRIDMRAWVEQLAIALLARWIRENREMLLKPEVAVASLEEQLRKLSG